MKKFVFLKALLLFCLAYLSVEIFVRRHVFDQIPTQISSGVVYGILGINVLIILWMVRRFLSASRR